MELKIKCCGNCPFCVTEYDDYSIGNDTTETCNLAYFLKKDEYYINLYNRSDIDNIKYCEYCEDFNIDDECISDENAFDETKCACCDINNEEYISIPEWCPLNDEKIIITKDGI